MDIRPRGVVVSEQNTREADQSLRHSARGIGTMRAATSFYSQVYANAQRESLATNWTRDCMYPLETVDKGEGQ